MLFVQAVLRRKGTRCKYTPLLSIATASHGTERAMYYYYHECAARARPKPSLCNTYTTLVVALLTLLSSNECKERSDAIERHGRLNRGF